MNADRPPPRPPPPLPSDLSLDEITAYVYRHFAGLLTAEERAAERVWMGRAKQLHSSQPHGRRMLEFFQTREVTAAYPDLMRRIDDEGVVNVMRAAAERVLRDHPDEKILHTCSKCGALCSTPRAQQCFGCGFDWHTPNRE